MCKGGGVWKSIAIGLTLSVCMSVCVWGEVYMFTGHGHHLYIQTIETAQYVNVLPFMQYEYYRITL